MRNGGEYIRGYLASSDLSAGADVPLFNRDMVSRVLAIGERLVLDSVVINNGATAAVITLYQDKNGNNAVDAGEELYRASVAVNAQTFTDGAEIQLARLTAAGGKLRVVASIASVNTTIFLTGRILLT